MSANTASASRSVVRWTDREKLAIASVVVRLRDEHPFKSVLDLIRIAVSHMPTERQRHVQSMSQVNDWFIGFLRQAELNREQELEREHEASLREAKNDLSAVSVDRLFAELLTRFSSVIDPFIETKVNQILDRRIEQMQRTQYMLATAGQHKHNPNPAQDEPKTNRPHLVLIGLLPEQEQRMKAEFDAEADLLFISSDRAAAVPVVYYKHVDRVVMTKFIDHKTVSKFERGLGRNRVTVCTTRGIGAFRTLVHSAVHAWKAQAESQAA